MVIKLGSIILFGLPLLSSKFLWIFFFPLQQTLFEVVSLKVVLIDLLVAWTGESLGVLVLGSDCRVGATDLEGWLF